MPETAVSVSSDRPVRCGQQGVQALPPVVIIIDQTHAELRQWELCVLSLVTSDV